MGFATGRGGGADWGMYESCPADHKVFVHVAGAGHMEPIQGGRMNPFDAHFLGCHVANLKDSCDRIYGDSDDSICKAKNGWLQRHWQQSNGIHLDSVIPQDFNSAYLLHVFT